MKRLLMTCIAAVLILAAGSAQADMVNGSFETGNLTGWKTTPASPGDRVTVVTSHTDLSGTGTTSWAPTDGSFFARLKTDGGTSWTQLYQDFTAPAGYELTFDYFWDSQDYKSWNDMGIGKLLSGAEPGGSVVTIFFTHSVNTDPQNYWGTPWTSVSYNIPSTGTYTLVFEIKNYYDDQVDSYMGVDNVSVVPVPAAVLLGILGLGVAGVKLRKFA